jgi:hypothetical protein
MVKAHRFNLDIPEYLYKRTYEILNDQDERFMYYYIEKLDKIIYRRFLKKKVKEIVLFLNNEELINDIEHCKDDETIINLLKKFNLLIFKIILNSEIEEKNHNGFLLGYSLNRKRLNN